ncbi:MAG: TlpA family protein disulfide reductase [Planctomycetes bacterium]|nr:TlpA family protein disulfide reductase [Planctomycetota bacterium]
MRLWTLLGVVLLAGGVGLIGCNKADTANPAAPSGSGPVAAVEKIAASDSATATAPGKNTDGANSAPASNPASQPPANAAGAADPNMPADSAPTADPWLAGIQDERMVAAYNQMQQRAVSDPKDVDAHLNIIFILQNVGRMRTNQGETEKAYATYAESAKHARALIASGESIPEGANSFLSNVFYNDACARSLAKDTAAAQSAIEEALKFGFNDFEMLKTDEDLVALRAVPEFAGKLAGWETAAAEVHKRKAAEELAGFQSFPFDFEVTDVDGNPHKLADYKGKVLIVDIWGTWCPPCRAEIPSFITLQEKLGEQGFQMIGLNYENANDAETAAKVKAFMTDNKMNYPCALGSDATRDQVPNFEGYPTTLFIDRAGKVRMKAVGLHELAYLEAMVTTLLAEAAPQ